MIKIFKYSTALLMLGIGLAAGLTSWVLNIAHGWEASLAAAIICGIADAARISVPVIAANRGWSKQMVWGIFALGIFSLLNIANYTANKYGEKIWDSMQNKAGIVQRSAKIDELKGKIEGFAEKRKSSTLRQLAEDERGNKYCGEKCKTLQSLADAAERREALETELKRLETENDAVVEAVEPKGFALGFVAYGFSPVAAQTIVDAFWGFVRLVVLDMLVYFLIPGALMLREDRKAAKVAPFVDLAPKAGPKLTAKGEPRKYASQDEAYRRLVALLLETNDHAMLVSDRQLAKSVGASKTSMNKWLKKWHDEGKLLVAEHSKHKALISLRKAA
jgi:hypothetical protein